MKKQLALLIGTILISAALFGQTNGSAVEQWHQERINTQRSGMLTLGGWAAGNILVSSVMMGRTSGSRYRFHQMNVFWNIVNIGIAGAGYYGTAGSEVLPLNETVKAYHDFNKLLLLNAGLDVAYIMAGLYLKEKARNSQKRKHLYKGYGNSVILQGAFLFAFDIALYFVSNSNLQEILNHNDFQIMLSLSGVGMRIAL